MKRQHLNIILPLVVALFSISISAQVKPPDKEQSKIESFSAKSGSVIEKQFINVGQVGGIKVQALIISDAMSKLKVSGLRLESYSFDRFSSDAKVAFLDQDEIDGLIKTIEYLKTSVFPTTRETYTEVIYSSRGGFSAGAYFSDRAWSAFVQLERYDRKSMISLKPADFDNLLALVQQAKEKM